MAAANELPPEVIDQVIVAARYGRDVDLWLEVRRSAEDILARWWRQETVRRAREAENSGRSRRGRRRKDELSRTRLRAVALELTGRCREHGVPPPDSLVAMLAECLDLPPPGDVPAASRDRDRASWVRAVAYDAENLTLENGAMRMPRVGATALDACVDRKTVRLWRRDASYLEAVGARCARRLVRSPAADRAPAPAPLPPRT